MGSILQPFRAAVADDPDATLLIYLDASLSRSAVDAHSDALAVGLATAGVVRGDRVALLLQNVPQYVISLIAIWKLGAIAVACSPMLRAGELSKQLRHSGAGTLIALRSLQEEVVEPALPETSVRTLVTTGEADLLDRSDLLDPSLPAQEAPAPGAIDLCDLIGRHAGQRPQTHEPDGGDVAVLTYTSGTTGPAKGAMNTHGNILHAAAAYEEGAQLHRDDVVLGIAPLFHVTGLVAHIAVALSVPVPLVLAGRFDAQRTCELIERHRTTFTVAAVTAYTALLNAEGATERDLSSMRKAYSGGAPVSAASAEAWERRSGSPLHVVYGLTETTSPTHLVPLGMRAPTDPESGALSVGLPVAGTSTRILDEDGYELPSGGSGEIAISGPQVVPGYWQDPDASAHALPGGELRTGDVGRVDADGWLYVTDRLKDLINASGFKVWPREVEDVMIAHPAVLEAAVVGAPDAYRGETVEAYVALVPGAEVRPEELIAFARERLAAYKYPRSVHLLPELPKTASGKIMRRSLRIA